MKVVDGYPPNWDKIKAAFDPRPGTMFCYGDRVYYPGEAGRGISEALHAHEQVHSVQQGFDPEGWEAAIAEITGVA